MRATFEDQLIMLDCALTGVNYDEANQMFQNQSRFNDPATFLSDIYYLSDGGFSRLVAHIRENDSVILALTGNEPFSRSTRNWPNCKELIADIEDAITDKLQ